jgi:polysaccharide export outer membrane protein
MMPRPRPLRSVILAAPLLAALLLLGGCGALFGPDLPPVPATATGDYLLGRGDQVRIITFGEEQLTGEFRVGASGDIALPLVGAVHAEGLTPKQLEAAVAAALRRANMFRNPSVSVEVIAYRPVFILGEVARAGQYPYQPGMTVVTAAAVAGGYTYRAVQDRATIVRTVNGSAVEGAAGRQTYVEPGDVITVPERHF